MTIFVIDAPVAIDLATGGATIPPEHSLAAPTLLRPQALALVYESVRRGEIDERSGRKVLDDIRGLRIRLLGDRSLQDHAWRLAAKLNWPDTYQAEYIALTPAAGGRAGHRGQETRRRGAHIHRHRLPCRHPAAVEHRNILIRLDPRTAWANSQSPERTQEGLLTCCLVALCAFVAQAGRSTSSPRTAVAVFSASTPAAPIKSRRFERNPSRACGVRVRTLEYVVTMLTQASAV